MSILFESYLLNGLVIGILFGVPAGAIGVLTIQRGIKFGAAAGFVTGMGSTAADVIYAGIGVLGLELLSDFLIRYQLFISLIGSVLIGILGIRILLKRNEIPEAKEENDEKVSYFLFFSSAFLIAILNPATILSFLAVFSALGMLSGVSRADGSLFVGGIFLGTSCWWFTIAALAGVLKKKMTTGIYQKLNMVLGCFMLLFAAVILYRSISMK